MRIFYLELPDPNTYFIEKLPDPDAYFIEKLPDPDGDILFRVAGSGYVSLASI